MAPKAVTASAAGIERRKLTLCVVDDDDMYRDFVQRQVVGSGHRVIAVRDGAELFTALDVNRIDCVVLDYNFFRREWHGPVHESAEAGR